MIVVTGNRFAGEFEFLPYAPGPHFAQYEAVFASGNKLQRHVVRVEADRSIAALLKGFQSAFRRPEMCRFAGKAAEENLSAFSERNGRSGHSRKQSFRTQIQSNESRGGIVQPFGVAPDTANL